MSKRDLVLGLINQNCERLPLQAIVSQKVGNMVGAPLCFQEDLIVQIRRGAIAQTFCLGGLLPQNNDAFGNANKGLKSTPGGNSSLCTPVFRGFVQQHYRVSYLVVRPVSNCMGWERVIEKTGYLPGQWNYTLGIPCPPDKGGITKQSVSPLQNALPLQTLARPPAVPKK